MVEIQTGINTLAFQNACQYLQLGVTGTGTQAPEGGVEVGGAAVDGGQRVGNCQA